MRDASYYSAVFRFLPWEACRRKYSRHAYCGLLLLVWSPSLWAAPQSAAEQVPRVSLGEIKGTPGSSVMMPLSLTADPKQPLRSLAVDIEFVSKSLIFQRTSLGIAAELVNAKIEASVAKETTDANGLKHVTLRVTASLPEPPAKEGLPDGLLAYLIFDIAPEAQPFRIRLTPAIISANDLSNPPKQVANMGSQPGLVVIESQAALFDQMAPPIACFFFAH